MSPIKEGAHFLYLPEGSGYDGAYRFTDTYVKRDGRWQQIATHNCEIARK